MVYLKLLQHHSKPVVDVTRRMVVYVPTRLENNLSSV